MATDRRPVGPDLAALGKAARGLSRILLLPVLRTSYVYVLLGCCVGVASASGVALILYGASNLRHDPWHRSGCSGCCWPWRCCCGWGEREWWRSGDHRQSTLAAHFLKLLRGPRAGAEGFHEPNA